MIAGALDNRQGAGVAHREAFAGNAAEIAFTVDGAIQHRVADNDALSDDAGCPVGRNDQLATRKPLPT